MDKKIHFTFEGREYTLEYTRKTVEMMERQGFVIGDIASKPMSTLPALFKGAFLANHRFIKDEVVKAIFKKMTDKDGLTASLVEMYNDTLVDLMAEPDESEGNLTWTVSE